MIQDLETSWKKALRAEFTKNYFRDLIQFIDFEYKNYTIFPPKHQIFNAFKFTPFNDVKVIILGQDPYHGAQQANGLSFSVPEGCPLPPSLKNIFKELHTDLNLPISQNGNLESWAKQGVLLLNTSLSVRKGKAASHQKKGWENFTDAVIRILGEEKEHLVFNLWGNPAHQKADSIDKNKHFIIQTSHPSPLSAYRGFLGSKVFSKTNQYLSKVGKTTIDWEIPEVNLFKQL